MLFYICNSRWVDGSTLVYKHFKKDEPDNSKRKNCLQLIVNKDFPALNEESTLGEWSNTECERHHFNVLCEKTQQITFAKLTQIVFEMRKKYEKEKKELKDTIAEMQSVESDLRHELSEMKNNESISKEQIENLKQENKQFAEEIKSINEELSNIEIQGN